MTIDASNQHVNMNDAEVAARDALNEFLNRSRKLVRPTALKLTQELRQFLDDDAEGLVTECWYQNQAFKAEMAGRVFQAFSQHVEESTAHQCIRGALADYEIPGELIKAKRRSRKGPIPWQVDDRNRIRPNEENFLLAMEDAGISFRFNEFTGEGFVYGLADYGPRLADAEFGELYLLTQRSYGFKVSREDLRDIVRAEMRRNRFHPIRDYLSALEWDGVERLDEWLITYAGAEDSDYVRAVGSITMIAAIKRIFEPGCKFDEMTILESPEGRNKSSAIKVLAGDEYFLDEAPFGVETRQVIESLRGKWMIECPDLDGMNRAEVNTLKAFLSRSHDRAALKYERDSTVLPRQCIFFGTTNEEAYLISKTGNRRFWPVRIQCFDLQCLAQDRDQLWAEAMARYRGGASIRMPEELWAIARQHQADREVADEWEAIIWEWLDDKQRAPRFGLSETRVRIVDIAKEALGMQIEKLDQRTANRIAACMKRRNWKMFQRSDGNRWWKFAGP